MIRCPGRLLRRRALVLALAAVPALHAGCSAPTAPPAPVGGGRTLVLDFATFEQSVEPILVRHGCDAGGDCHGGGIRGTFALSPKGAKDTRFDFDQAVLQVATVDRASSPLLMKPLSSQAGGAPHSVEPFASTGDPDYRTILQWIEAGVLQ